MLSHIGADQRHEGLSEKSYSARLIVYTAHFFRAGLDFQDRVPVLSVLGLPLDMVRARVKFWSGTDGPKSFTRLNLSVPNQFFWYAYFFHPSRAKNFRPCKWGLSYSVCQINRVKASFNSEALLLIISSLVFSKMLYCASVLSNTSATKDIQDQIYSEFCLENSYKF